MSRSKYLIYLLRHNLKEVEDDGYVCMELLIQEYNFTKEEIFEYVSKDEKTRFQLNESKDKIRATQGHSLKHVDGTKCFKEMSLDDLNQLMYKKIVHYTYEKNIDSIIQNGLKPMNRTSIHFLIILNDSINIKRKKGTDTEISLNVEKWLEDGHKIYKSENGYVMVLEPIDKKYLNIDKIGY